MVAFVRSRLCADERGFTLVEMMMSIVVGMIVLYAGFTLLDGSTVASSRVTARVDAAQRGRVAMDAIARPLRSQACVTSTGLGTTSWLVEARKDAVEFYSDARSQAAPTEFQPERHRVSYDAASGTVTDVMWQSTGMSPAFTFPTEPTRSRVILTDAAPPATGGAVFRYYTYTGSAPYRPDAELTPASGAALTDANRAQVVRVGVTLLTRPAKGTGIGPEGLASNMQSSVVARLANPQNPTGGPGCA